MKKNKSLLLLFFFIGFLLWGADLAFALEVSLRGLGENPSLARYVEYIYSWGVSLAGTIAVISFAIGAIGYMVSGDNPELQSSSKDRMKGAILGAVLLVSSYLIMNTINPQLVNPKLTPVEEAVLTPTPPAPGVYYFSNNCGGNEEVEKNAIGGRHLSSDDYIGDSVKFIKIINDEKSNTYYGVIFHKNRGVKNGGICSLPITDEGCQSVMSGTSAISIFRLNKDPATSGNGVDFFSEPFGEDRGSKAGYYMVSGDAIKYPYKKIPASEMSFIYTNVDQPNAYIRKNKTFQDKPGSIDMNGAYLVAIYSDQNYCQTFESATLEDARVPNLEGEPVTKFGSRKIGDIYIVPVGSFGGGSPDGGGAMRGW